MADNAVGYGDVVGTVNVSSDDGQSRADALRDTLNELNSDHSLVTCFERVVADHPFHTAILSDGWALTYSELNRVANRLAHAIAASGTRPGDRVAILMEHDAPAVAALIASLKAGGIAVVLNRTHPVERLRYTIEDSDSRVIVTDNASNALAAEIAAPDSAILIFEHSAMNGPEDDLLIPVPPDETAVLGYTSGSTGRPKAVMMTHRKLRRSTTIHTEAMHYSAEDRISLFASLGSGQGMSNSWGALLTGATLCPFPLTVKGMAGLVSWIERCRLSIYSSSASVFRNFIGTLDPSHMFHGIRVVRLSSEPATSGDFRMFQRHFPDDCVFVHTLSSSETGNIAWSSRSKHDSVADGRLPIGLFAKEQEVLLLDDDGRPVPRGEVGEIVVRGRHLSNGYWRDPQLTAQRFSAVRDGNGARQFRTGDFGRINAHGLLEFRGRRDDRVKIRGNRIEFGEIETAVQGLQGVRRVIVEAIARSEHEPVLVGFVTLQGSQVWSSADLRRALRAVVPDHMIPSEFVILDDFPLTQNGKIDREKLRQDYRPRRRHQFDEPPQTPTESLLAAIWSEVFGCADIGRHEDFFVLGGDSLLAAVVSARIHHALKVDLDLAMFAEHPILADLAAAIDARGAAETADEVPLVPVPRTAALPLSFAQERIWKNSRTAGESAGYTMARIYRIAGPLNRDMLRACMDEMARRHEILRTVFVERGGRPVQEVDPAMAPPPLDYTDLSSTADPEATAETLFKAKAAHVFDLTRGPLLRFHLVCLRDNEHWLLRVSHHIISDNASWVLYFDELALLYEARLSGDASRRPPAPLLHYADYAVWQRQRFGREGIGYSRSVKWWTENLSGASRPMRLPFLRDRPVQAVVPADGKMSWGIERQVSHRLNMLSSLHRSTHLTMRLAVFAALIAADSGSSDSAIGMYCSGRTRMPLLNVLGGFTNLVTLRLRCNPSKSFLDWLTTVRDQALRAEAESGVPFEELFAELKRGGVDPPVVQAIFHAALSRRVLEFGGLTLTTLDRARQSFPWGFTLEFNDQDESNGCQALFDPRIYDPARVRVFVERYKRLLDAVSRDPSRTLRTLVGSIAQ